MVGLALSGGGFRASLFHLGVLRRLWEVGLLAGSPQRPWKPMQITHLSSVSGGSITAALYLYILKQRGDSVCFQAVERALIAGIKKNLRVKWLVLRFGLLFILIVTAAWAFWFYFPPFGQWWQIFALLVITTVLYYVLRSRHVMAWLYRLYFYGGLRLGQLPEVPRLIINATSLNSGSGFFFTRDYVGDEPAQAFAAGGAVENILLANAVGASAAVPGIFGPFRVPKQGFMVDGGVWDNQGLAVYFNDPTQSRRERVPYLIGSDASRTLAPIAPRVRPYKPFPLLDRIDILARSSTITGDTARKWLYGMLLHKWSDRRLRQFAAFHTLPGSYDSDYTIPAPDALIPLVARIRTDLDSFSDLEIRALMYHGYSLANSRIFSHCWDVLGALAGVVIAAKQTFPDLAGLDRYDNRFIAAELPWNVFLQAVPVGAAIPQMKSWQEFNAELDREAGDTLRSRRWREFGQNPTDLNLQEAARRHLQYSNVKSSIWRYVRRLRDNALR